MEDFSFVERVLARLPAQPPSAFAFQHWPHAKRPTDEGLALAPVPGVDPERLIAAVMDVDNYVGNVQHVAQSRSIADARYTPPQAVRFYQRVEIPVIGAVHHELVLHDLGERAGYRVAAWNLLGPATDALSKREAVRSDYNAGAWLVAPGVVGYALASAPRRGDVGYLKFKALTKGADLAASRVLEANIAGMAAWAQRR